LPGANALTLIILPINITVNSSIAAVSALDIAPLNAQVSKLLHVSVSGLSPSTSYSAIEKWYLPNGTVTSFSAPVPFTTPATDFSPTFVSLQP
jgi:hypothetical protein